MNRVPSKHAIPLISIVIPAHNEAEHIGDCIASVLANEFTPDQIQILVIDHASTDSTAEIARDAGAAVLSVTSGKIGAVRNAGLAAAQGEFIAYVDGDCTVPQTWLKTAASLLESDRNTGAVGGPCLSPAKGTWVERSLAPSKVIPEVVSSVKAIATSSFIARTALLRDLGGFDETLTSGEDDELSNRIRSQGLTLISASNCHIIHHGYPRTWVSTLKKEIWHGSHHIDVRTSFDLTLILSFIFLASSGLLPLLLGAASVTGTPMLRDACIAALCLEFTPPLLFALKRIRLCPSDWRLILPLLAVGYAYFTGHGLGVLSNIWRRTQLRLRGEEAKLASHPVSESSPER